MQNNRNVLIIFDFNRTLYDPQKGRLYAGVRDVLKDFFEKNVKLVLATMVEGKRNEIIKKEFLGEVFQEIHNVRRKTPEIFAQIVKKMNAKEVYVVGDYLHAEIFCGNAIGATTVWLKQGKFAQEHWQARNEKPDHVIEDITELPGIVGV